MSRLNEAATRNPRRARQDIRCALVASAIALGMSSASPAIAASLATFDRVTAFVDSSGLCANGAQTVQNIGAASVPDIRCSNASFSATTSALSEFGALHALGDLRFTGFTFGPQTQFASFEAQVRAQYFDTLLFGPGAATWEVTVGVSGQSVFITNGKAFDKNVGWCFNLFGSVCSSGAVLANIGTATFDVPIPKDGILAISPALLIDLSSSFQRDGSGAPPDPDNFDEFVDLSHTVQFLGSQVLDASGHPIFGATITADSGFDYTAGAPSVSSVPEEPAFAYMALGLSGVMFGRWKKHRKVSRATAWLKSSLWMLARAIECPPRLSWNTSSTHHAGQSAASRP